MKLLIKARCIWLSGEGVLFVAVVCGYQLLAELVCSVCVQIVYVSLLRSIILSLQHRIFSYNVAVQMTRCLFYIKTIVKIL
jgi:hypothetical protein